MKELFCECVLLRSYNIDAIDALIYCRVTKYVLYSKVWDSMYGHVWSFISTIYVGLIFLYIIHMIVLIIVFPSQIQGKKVLKI